MEQDLRYYRCNACSFRARTQYCSRQYVLPERMADGIYWRNYFEPEPILWMQQRNSWCEVCNNIWPIECLGEDFWRSDADDLPGVIQTIEVLRRRTSRCLRCGTEKISVPESAGTDLQHLPCDGVLQCGYRISSASPIYLPMGHWYSPEGALVKKGFYWHTGKGAVAKNLDFPLWIEPCPYDDNEFSWDAYSD